MWEIICFVQGIVILGMGYWIASLQTKLSAVRRRNASLRERMPSHDAFRQPSQLLEC